MTYDLAERKIVALLSSDVEPRVALNVIGHLSIAIGAYADANLMGRARLVDKTGVSHLGIARYSYIVKVARPAKLRRAIATARATDLLVAAFPQEMLSTGHDDELADAIAAADEDSLTYLGAVFYGPTVEVDAVCGRFSLWQMGAPPLDSRDRAPDDQRPHTDRAFN